MEHKNYSGFTIFEIMIVLILIGLISGGIIAGQSLIRSAGINSISNEAQKITAAIHDFQLQYNAYPGDFRQATRFWGEANASWDDCVATDKTNTALTCDGNGDGYMGRSIDETDGTIKYGEMFLIWHHLWNAKLLNTTFSGAPGPEGDMDHVVGINSPGSGFGVNNGFGLRFVGTAPSDDWFDGEYGHVLMFGADAAENDMPRNAALTPEEMQNFDSKFDDGKPAAGNIITFTGDANPNCTQVAIDDDDQTADEDLDATYRLSFTQAACNIIYRNYVE